MKLKRIIMSMLIVISTVGILTACSDDTANSGDADTNTSEDANTEDTTGTGGENMEFSHSEYFDENGFFKGITATEYIDLFDYKSMELPSDVTTLSDEDFQSQIDSILSQYAQVELVEDSNYAIENGDTVNIDYVGSVDGVEFENGSTQGMGTDVIIGVTQYIDDFLEQLIGHKVGENFDIEVTFPEIYPGNTDLQNKDAIFNITINSISKTVTPELTDEFVSTNSGGEITSADDFLKDLEESMLTYQLLTYVSDELRNNSTIRDVPAEAEAYYKAMLNDQMTYEAANSGMETDAYLLSIGFESFDEFYASQKPSVDEAIISTLIFQAIAENENLKVTEDDIDNYFELNFSTTDWSGYAEVFGENYIKSMVLQFEVVTNYLIDFFS